jgi:hypothetical protein
VLVETHLALPHCTDWFVELGVSHDREARGDAAGSAYAEGSERASIVALRPRLVKVSPPSSEGG